MSLQRVRRIASSFVPTRRSRQCIPTTLEKQVKRISCNVNAVTGMRQNKKDKVLESEANTFI